MYLFVLSLVSFQYFVFNTFCLFDRPCAVDITLNSLTYFLVYSFQCVCVCVGGGVLLFNSKTLIIPQGAILLFLLVVVVMVVVEVFLFSFFLLGRLSISLFFENKLYLMLLFLCVFQESVVPLPA